jgi:hypothetical protein
MTNESGLRSFAPFKFPLNGGADELGLALSFVQGGLDPGQRSRWESGRGGFLIYAFSTHGAKINDIFYVDKEKIGDIIYPSEETKMTYQEAKAIRASIEGEVKRLGDALRLFPVGPMGLTPDAVKASPEFRAAKSAFDVAFAQLRTTNDYLRRAFSTEIRAERRARRAA